MATKTKQTSKRSCCIQLTLEQHGFKPCGSADMKIFFSKYTRPFASAGFTGHSQPKRLKTVFSRFRSRFPSLGWKILFLICDWLNLKLLSSTRVLLPGFSVGGWVSEPVTPRVVQGSSVLTQGACLLFGAFAFPMRFFFFFFFLDEKMSGQGLSHQFSGARHCAGHFLSITAFEPPLQPMILDLQIWILKLRGDGTC